MVRIVLSSLLTLALSFSVASAADTISANQLESLASAASTLQAGQTGTVTLTIDGMQVSYTVTKDSLGNITATGPAGASIQTIAISTGPVGNNTSAPLAVTIISAAGGITSLNIGTDSNGNITSVSAASDTVTVGTTTGTTTVTSSTTTSAPSGADTFTTSTTTGGGGSVTGTVTVTFAPGTSPLSLTVSPHK